MTGDFKNVCMARHTEQYLTINIQQQQHRCILTTTTKRKLCMMHRCLAKTHLLHLGIPVAQMMGINGICALNALPTSMALTQP